ncbi:hypothetical protein RFI_09627 [Reticulomyxa filosa]|uniref:Uncharacterized protein n=1 Tax=Reticulomyxa filosa TaxID=46433 RepID=X6NNJ9_RETFI|nr:hypothetical protein RFI_09627 [Reticulomyxa filosa]|eukprot:ETO27503.1 hypothetical protein RFI_09627 [Reticulomyxa filosa]
MTKMDFSVCDEYLLKLGLVIPLRRVGPETLNKKKIQNNKHKQIEQQLQTIQYIKYSFPDLSIDIISMEEKLLLNLSDTGIHFFFVLYVHVFILFVSFVLVCFITAVRTFFWAKKGGDPRYRRPPPKGKRGQFRLIISGISSDTTAEEIRKWAESEKLQSIALTDVYNRHGMVKNSVLSLSYCFFMKLLLHTKKGNNKKKRAKE